MTVRERCKKDIQNGKKNSFTEYLTKDIIPNRPKEMESSRLKKIHSAFIHLATSTTNFKSKLNVTMPF